MEALIRVFDRLRVFNRRLNNIDQRLRALEKPMGLTTGEEYPDRIVSSAVTEVIDPICEPHPIPILYGPGAEELTREQMNPTRYRLGSDGDGHYYLFPDDKRKDWWDWVDSRSEDVPDWAKRIDGYTHFTFTDPQEDQ